MLKFRDALLRCSVNDCYLKRVGGTDEYRVGKHNWTRKEREQREYFTNDLLDAVITSGRL